MTNSRSYLVVFHGDWEGEVLMDRANDPCFDHPPSWGICRPPLRKILRMGDLLFFICRTHKEKDYYLKGWFEVAEEKLDYTTALERFPRRLNVIISRTPNTKLPRWRGLNHEKKYANLYGNNNPEFLRQLKTDSEVFYPNPEDDHCSDEWKCRRIFHCGKKQFEKCIDSNKCHKDGASLKQLRYANYVISNDDHYELLDHLKISLEVIRHYTGWKESISTPCNQHNYRKFDLYRDKMFDLINEFKKIRATNKD